MLIPGDHFELMTVRGIEPRTVCGPVKCENGIWHVPHETGVFVGTYCPIAISATRRFAHFDKFGKRKVENEHYC